jgi:hypothetical protein
MWQVGAEVASCCAAMCQLRFNSLLMWLCVAVPCGIGWVRWPCVAVPCGMDWGEVDVYPWKISRMSSRLNEK